MEKYTYYQIRKFFLILMFIGVFNYGTQLFKFDLISVISKYLNFGYNIENLIKGTIFIVGVYLLIDGNLITPFLGDAVLPCALLDKEPPKDADITKKIITTPNIKVVYWASLHDKNDKIVWDAYGDYSNSGVVFSDKNGVAILKVKKPSRYILPNGSKLAPHIHYRICPQYEDKEGMMGPVKTIFL